MRKRNVNLGGKLLLMPYASVTALGLNKKTIGGTKTLPLQITKYLKLKWRLSAIQLNKKPTTATDQLYLSMRFPKPCLLQM